MGASEEKPVHPLPVGRIVRHYGQQWPSAARLGTGTVLRVRGPYGDGSYEYDVLTGQEFAIMPGPDNPRTRVAQWSSSATIPVDPPPAS